MFSRSEKSMQGQPWPEMFQNPGMGNTMWPMGQGQGQPQEAQPQAYAQPVYSNKPSGFTHTLYIILFILITILFVMDLLYTIKNPSPVNIISTGILFIVWLLFIPTLK